MLRRWCFFCQGSVRATPRPWCEKKLPFAFSSSWSTSLSSTSTSSTCARTRPLENHESPRSLIVSPSSIPRVGGGTVRRLRASCSLADIYELRIRAYHHNLILFWLYIFIYPRVYRHANTLFIFLTSRIFGYFDNTCLWMGQKIFFSE